MYVYIGLYRCIFNTLMHFTVNVISAAGLWAIWKLRNECCFQNNKMWQDMGQMLMKISGLT
jgi:hypothetical protein